MQSKKGTLILITTFLLSIPIVFSVTSGGIYDTYLEYYGWLDFGLYLIIFTGIIQIFVESRFQGNEGKGARAIAWGLGFTLALALVTWEIKNGYYLFQIGPLILIFLALIPIIKISKWIKSSDKSSNISLLKSGLIGIIILLLIIYFFFPSLIDSLPFYWTDNLFWIIFIIVFILLLITLGKERAVSATGTLAGGGKRLIGDTYDALTNIGKDAYGAATRIGKDAYDATTRVAGDVYGTKEERDLKSYGKYLKKGIDVYILPKPYSTKSFRRKKREKAHKKTIWVKAGDPLRLKAMVEGGSKNFHYIWTVNNKPPENYYTLDEIEGVVTIPTEVLQTLEDQTILEKYKNSDRILGNLKSNIGVYKWEVYVEDVEALRLGYKKGRASDVITIIITRNKKIEERQIKELRKARISEFKEGTKKLGVEAGIGAMQATKIAGEELGKVGKDIGKKFERYRERAKREVKIKSINTIEERESKEYEEGGWLKKLWLIRSGRRIKLISKNKGEFKNLTWSIKKEGENKETILGEGETISYKFDRKKFKKGYYKINLKGIYENTKDENGKEVKIKEFKEDTAEVYIKEKPEVKVSLVYTDKDKRDIEITKNRDGEYILEDDKEYGINFNLIKDKQADEIIDDILDKEKKKIAKPLRDIEKDDLFKIRINPNIFEEGKKYRLSYNLIINDKFRYQEIIPVELEIRVIKIKKEETPIQKEESRKEKRKILKGKKLVEELEGKEDTIIEEIKESRREISVSEQFENLKKIFEESLKSILNDTLNKFNYSNSLLKGEIKNIEGMMTYDRSIEDELKELFSNLNRIIENENEIKKNFLNIKNMLKDVPPSSIQYFNDLSINNEAMSNKIINTCEKIITYIEKQKLDKKSMEEREIILNNVVKKISEIKEESTIYRKQVSKSFSKIKKLLRSNPLTIVPEFFEKFFKKTIGI